MLRKSAAYRIRSDSNRTAREHAAAQEEIEPSGVDLLERQETHGIVRDAVLALREPYRSVVALHYFSSASNDEIALRQGVTASTVRSQLSRAHRELASVLDARFDGDRRAWCLAIMPIAASESIRERRLASEPGRVFFITVGAVLSLVLSLGLWSALGDGSARQESGELASARPDRGDRELAPLAARSGDRVEVDPMSATITPTRARVRGVLIDAASEEALPECLLEIQLGDGTAEELTTGPGGEFESRHELAAGPVTLSIRDYRGIQVAMSIGGNVAFSSSGQWPATVDWDPARAPVRVHVPIAAGYHLALTAPPEALGLTWSATVQSVPSEMCDEGTYAWKLEAPVRGGSSPWVRFFSRFGESHSSAGPWILELRSSDGWWWARVDVPPTTGIRTQPIAVEVHRAARLEVDVLDHEHARPSQAWLDLVSTPDALKGARSVRVVGEAGSGIVVPNLAPGTYRIRAGAEGCTTASAVVELRSGETLRHEMLLAPTPWDAYVEGVLQTSGEPPPQSDQLQLRDPETGESYYDQSESEWVEADGKWQRTFRIGPMPHRRYDLIACREYWLWTVSPRAVKAPVQGLTITLQRREPARTLEIRPIDALTGEKLEVATCIAMVDGGLPFYCASLSVGHRITSAVSLRAPIDASIQWCVRAEGRIPVWGTDKDFASSRDGDVADALLHPGWGAHLRVVDAESDDDAPLGGVAILLDGEVVGTTGADGRIELLRAESPRSIEVRREGWSLAGGDLDPFTRRLRDRAITHVVRMARQH
jgi:hypothetical protein